MLTGIVAGLAFLGGLVAPTLAEVFKHLALSPLLKKERDEENVESRSAKSADDCYTELALLRDVIPKLSSIRRSAGTEEQHSERDATRLEHDNSLSRLEASIVLLRSKSRQEMEVVLELLRYAHDLPEYRSRTIAFKFGWHPDTASQIADATVRYAREVLASEIRRETLPGRPAQIDEYLRALQDRHDELTQEFAEEVYEERQTLEEWRSTHGLSPTRPAWHVRG